MFKIFRGLFGEIIVVPLNGLSETAYIILGMILAGGVMLFPLYSVGLDNTISFFAVCFGGIIASLLISVIIGPGAGCAWGGLIISFAVHKLSSTMGFNPLGIIAIIMIGLIVLMPIACIVDNSYNFLSIISLATSFLTICCGTINTDNITGFEDCNLYNIIHIMEYISQPARNTGIFRPSMLCFYIIAITFTIVEGVGKVLERCRKR